ncbi:MAG TPA: sigma-54 dependent transcriptional regulator [Dongiaceae bacterium]|nr:sigma-54 dependent transcriptional regulator [Dongiaceae bacterium]
MKGKILIVDDDATIRGMLGQALMPHYTIAEAADGAGIRKLFPSLQPDVVLLDMNLPGDSGIDLLPTIKKQWPDAEVIMITGEPSLDAAVEATKRGAFHFISKPFELANLVVMVDRAMEHKELRAENNALHEALVSGNGSLKPIFHSQPMKAVVRMIERVAPSDVSILVTGESGTGKEVIADLVHTLSPRRRGPLVKINCAALPRELIESELFGSVKGAYTGAHADREGLFRQAEEGTLFLDEISEMPVDTQSKLLRVLQEKEVRPIGGKTSYQTNCRIVAATNRKTEEAIKDGKLREDLFYRISAITVHLPPLRERRDDIQPLAESFLRRFAAQANRVITGFTPLAVERLTSFEWPGNARQLQNEIQRAVLLCEGTVIDVADLSITTFQTVGPSSTAVPDETGSDVNYTLLEGVERNAIVQMLKETNGNKLETAKRLGIGRQTLYNKIKAYGIEA